MSDPTPTPGPHPAAAGAAPDHDALGRVMDAFMRGVSDSFDRVLARGDVAEVLGGFLEGEVVFAMTRDELRVLRAPAAESTKPDPPTGQYL